MKIHRAISVLAATAWTMLCGVNAVAQNPSPPLARERPIVIGTSYKLRSAILGDERTINVRLPDSYGEAGRRFPVLVLLDGGEKEDFLHIAGLAQITAAYGQGQEHIVVGIEGVDRRHDLTSPSSVPEDLRRAPTAGGAAKYRRFLAQELKPWVASRYRTDGRTAIIGESLAGLFVLETLLLEPTIFEDYIAVSPSLWWNGGSLANGAAAHLRRGRLAGRRLWLGFDIPSPPADAAGRERAVQDRLVEAFRSAAPSGFNWSATRLKESHGTVYHPAALQAFRALYAIIPVER